MHHYSLELRFRLIFTDISLLDLTFEWKGTEWCENAAKVRQGNDKRVLNFFSCVEQALERMRLNWMNPRKKLIEYEHAMKNSLEPNNMFRNNLSPNQIKSSFRSTLKGFLFKAVFEIDPSSDEVTLLLSEVMLEKGINKLTEDNISLDELKESQRKSLAYIQTIYKCLVCQKKERNHML